MPAANQYGNNFEVVVHKLYGKPAYEMLKIFSSKQMTYEQVAKLTGFALSTVRKWCRNYNVRLAYKMNERMKGLTEFEEMFQKEELNYYNVLSRSWNSKEKVHIRYENFIGKQRSNTNQKNQ
ncbi:hypothetical protein [Cysteiniphilum litorale]|uniref:hypothetical protein n=1 Tax=Cysteiniphilum litorale TaxID=2056700 RepID=UPI003F8830EC